MGKKNTGEQHSGWLRRPWVWGSLGVLGVLVITALIIVTVRPEWSQRAWEATGVGCGRDLSQEDPEDFASPWTPWENTDEGRSQEPDRKEHREAIEAIADTLGYEPVAQVPRETDFLDEGRTLSPKVDLTPAGEQILVELSGTSDMHRVAAVEPVTGDPLWQWDLKTGRELEIHEHGNYLVVSNLISQAESGFLDADQSELLSIQMSTGEEQECQRFDSDYLFHPGHGETGLLVESSSNHAAEQDGLSAATVQQFSLSDFSLGFSHLYPHLEGMGSDRYQHGRAQPISVLDENVYITYAYDFDYGGPDGALSAARYTDRHFSSDLVPVVAHSMDTGKKLWEIGEPGDQIAFITGVPDLDEGGTGLLTAEFGELTTDEEDPERGSSTVTLQMYDSEGNQLWELPAPDSEVFIADVGEIAVLEGVILLRTGVDEVSALDAVTGEQLWNLNESGQDRRPSSLDEAITVDGMFYLHGEPQPYLINLQTGEEDEQAAAAIDRAEVVDVSSVGDEWLLVETASNGYAVLQRQEG